jgi:hypothetical protein
LDSSAPFSPGLMLAAARQPCVWKLKYSRGFENRLPRTESPGLAQFDESPGLSNSESFRSLQSRALIQNMNFSAACESQPFS